MQTGRLDQALEEVTLAEKAGFKVNPQDGPEVPAAQAGKVTDQSPNAGDKKPKGTTVTIKGEKRDEKEEKKKDYYLSERRYGSFQRSFGVPDGVDADKIAATFKNGVLTVTLPKTAEAQKSEKKIAINKA